MLPFLPSSEVETAFEALSETAPSELDKLFEYFGKNYIYENTSRFPVIKWNHFETTKNGLLKTTNSIESWHMLINSQLNKKHPGILKMIQFLKGEEIKYKQLMIDIDSGKSWPIRKSRAQITKERQFLNVFETYGDCENPLKYLKNLAYNYLFSEAI